MGNKLRSDVLRTYVRIEDITISNKNGQDLVLKNTRVVQCRETNVISFLLQLLNEGYKITTDIKNKLPFIKVAKNNKTFVFYGGLRPNLCFLEAQVRTSTLITNINLSESAIITKRKN